MGEPARCTAALAVHGGTVQSVAFLRHGMACPSRPATPCPSAVSIRPHGWARQLPAQPHVADGDDNLPLSCLTGACCYGSWRRAAVPCPHAWGQGRQAVHPFAQNQCLPSHARMRRQMHDLRGSSCRADQAVLAGEVAWRPAGPCGPAQELPTHHKLAWWVPPPTSKAPPYITSNLQSAGLSCLLIALGMCGVPGEGASRRRGEAHAVARTTM